MEKYLIPQDLTVFGFRVQTFPTGIGEAFEQLQRELVPAGLRSYYGLSRCTPNGIEYYAAAAETFAGEGKSYGYETYVIKKGEYLSVDLHGWRQKLHSIKNIFSELLQNEQADKNDLAVEWYRDMEVMQCLVKIDPFISIPGEVEEAKREFIELISAFDKNLINTIPFEGSWTAAQIGDHVLKSDRGMIRLLNGPTTATSRDPGENIETLRSQFMDFTSKMQSPEFIRPSEDHYDKELLLADLQTAASEMNTAARTLDLTASCKNPLLGELTRLELLSFVNYHTRRHSHQLQKITLQMQNAK